MQVQEGLGSLANMLRHSGRPEIPQGHHRGVPEPRVGDARHQRRDRGRLTTQIRPVPPSASTTAPRSKFVGFVLKSRGMPADTQFIVEEYTDNGQTLVLRPVGLRGRFLVNGKPFTVPISAAYRRPPHSDDVSVVVKANGLAIYGEGRRPAGRSSWSPSTATAR